ncbi:crescerin-2 [Ananas comosus]|uniref:Crescerin-2 n=1 Tax=Ananas comosus TaxID=4615 RepID=A0A6P5F0M3_ANACO|nr:crescerin-2 [Ananas comosus]
MSLKTKTLTNLFPSLSNPPFPSISKSKLNMALRSLDNALPTSVAERPKKPAAKAAAAPTAEVPRDSRQNDENSPLPLQTQPAKAAEQAVEYVASDDLEPLPNPESKIANLLAELDSKDWVKSCGALNDVRRLAIHHSSLLLPIMECVMVVIVKAMKNPRSALCKTSIMACADIFRSFGRLLLSSSTKEEAAFDNLLLQLLLKASQDKRFVCEEAEKALQTMAVSLPPLPLLKKLKSYVNHTNLRVRAKSAVAISKCVSRMEVEVMKEFGLATLLQVAAELLNDRLPEAREASRSIIHSIHNGFSRDNTSNENAENESSTAELWESFCSSNLPPLSVLSVVRIISQ